MFFFLYAINPLVLYFVSFPFYYFWQVLPTAAVAIALLSSPRDEKPRVKALLGGALVVTTGFFLGISLLSRPTTIGIVALFYGLVAFKRVLPISRVIAALAVTVLTFTALNSPTDRSFWHSAYIGIGAYPNPYVDRFSDNAGYELFEAERGIQLNKNIEGNYYYGCLK